MTRLAVLSLGPLVLAAVNPLPEGWLNLDVLAAVIPVCLGIGLAVAWLAEGMGAIVAFLWALVRDV